MIRQRGLSLIEIIIVIAYIAIVVWAASYGGKRYGALGVLVGLAAGAGIPIAVFYIGRSPTFLILGLPLLMVGAHLLRPEVFLLRLAGAAAVLWVGTIVIGLVGELLAGREVGFTVGHATGVVVAGSVLFLFWGWTSTATILAVLLLWSVAGSLYDRFRRA